MLGLAGAAGAGMLGGAMGQVGDALSMPRRALWGMLGMPDTGRELVGNTLGLDPQGGLAGALGMGAEMLLDPLTLAGLAAGGPLAKLAYSPWAKDAQLAELVSGARAGVGEAESALAARSALEAQTLQEQTQAALGLGKYDVPGIAGGASRQFKYLADPDAALELMGRGIGTPLAPTGVGPQGGGAAVYGRQIPFGFANPQMRGAGGRMIGSGIGVDASVPLDQIPRPLTDFDRQFLANFGGGQTLGGPLQMSDLEVQGALEALGKQVGGNLNAARPMPTLGQATEGNPLLSELLGRGGGLQQFGGLPLPQAPAALGGEADRLAQLLQSRKMTPKDWAMVAGAGGLGLGAGAALGGR